MKYKFYYFFSWLLKSLDKDPTCFTHLAPSRPPPKPEIQNLLSVLSLLSEALNPKPLHP